MPLHLRKRGDVWHARGTIRVGRDSIAVASFSTGARAKAAAESIAAAEEARIRAEHLEGDAGRARRLTIADCIETYLGRPGGVPDYDKDRLADFNTRIGARPLTEIDSAWAEWLRTRGAAMAPATAARHRSILQAALNAGSKHAPRIPTVRERRDDRIAHLLDSEREALIRAYNLSANPPVLLLAYAGLRTQEALQLDWGEVDLVRRRLIIGRTKSGRTRVVPMHPKVALLLHGMHVAAGSPARGPVFMSSRGAPYADTRGQGGNPLAQAHITACKAVGIAGFRVHDWRHDFALRFLHQGGDVRSLMQVMGWASIRMAERYVVYKADHLAAIMDKVA